MWRSACQVDTFYMFPSHWCGGCFALNLIVTTTTTTHSTFNCRRRSSCEFCEWMWLRVISPIIPYTRKVDTKRKHCILPPNMFGLNRKSFESMADSVASIFKWLLHYCGKRVCLAVGINSTNYRQHKQQMSAGCFIVWECVQSTHE